VLTNQLANAIRRFLLEVWHGERVDLAGWGPFPDLTSRGRRALFTTVITREL
jgi:hypothetical protein